MDSSSNQKIDRDIKWAWMVAVVSAVVWLVLIVGTGSGKLLSGYLPENLAELFSAWNLFDVAILLGLGFGVYKRSRVCSILLASYAGIALLVAIIGTEPHRAVSQALYLYVIFRGTIAVFRYRKLQVSSMQASNVSAASAQGPVAPRADESHEQPEISASYIYLWYADQNHGPYMLDQIPSMWATGIITANALYWDNDASKWKPVIELLSGNEASSSKGPSPHPPDEDGEVPAYVPKIQNESNTSERLTSEKSVVPPHGDVEPRPWRRLWARLLDFQILGGIPSSILDPILILLFPAFFARNPSVLLGIAWACAYLFESLCLSKFGTTPGKWLLGIALRKSDGSKLSQIEAGRRFNAVAWRSIPFILPLSGLLAYRDLKKSGATKWDRKRGHVVTYSPISGARWFVSMALVIVFVASYAVGIVALLGQDDGYAERYSFQPISTVPPSTTLSQSSSTTENDEEFAQQRAKSKAEAMSLYPDVADHNTRLGREVDRLIESYKSTDDPILYAPDAPMLITNVAAKNLGVASRQK